MKKSEFIKKAALEFEERSNNQQYKGYSYEGLAEEFLSIFETMDFSLVDESGEKTIYEPEEGWDAYLAEEDRKDNLRDFTIVEGCTVRGHDIAERFLKGETFEEIAQHYNVTRERIRQIVAKERRRYFRSIELNPEMDKK